MGGLNKLEFTCQHSVVYVHAEVEKCEHKHESSNISQKIQNFLSIKLGGKFVPNVVIKSRHKNWYDDKH